DGVRVPKSHLRVDAYGEVDELNSALGLAAAWMADGDMVDFVHDLQRQLFAVGAQLADPREGDVRSKTKGRIDPAWVAAMEARIDGFESGLPPLKRFILAGGSPAGAALHLARTVCRRAERAVVRLKAEAAVEDVV